MNSSRRLVIDIGTNSVLALLADVSGDRVDVIFDKQKITRLGEDLLNLGRLSDEAMRRTAEAVRSFMENAEFDLAVLIGTEALRVASNSAEFAGLLERVTRQRPTIISGRKEAELTFRGAVLDLDLISDDLIVVDVGGGSTEIIKGRSGRIIDIESVPIGALRLRESTHDDSLSAYKNCASDFLKKRRIIDSALSAKKMIAVGGTITSLATMAAGLQKYDARAIQGYSLSEQEIESTGLRFEGTNNDERRNLIPFDPDRADLILPGAGIFMALMSITGMFELTVSTGGLRFGAALLPEIVSG